MSFLEAEIAKCDRRIMKIAENSDPKSLRSNKRWYELERELRHTQLQAWREGRKIASASGNNGIQILLRALGFEWLDFIESASRIEDADNYFKVLRSAGYPDDACDWTVVAIGMLVSGDLPAPNFVVTSNLNCDPAMIAMNAVARENSVPIFGLDVALTPSPQSLAYVTRQLEELIAFVEAHFPGLRYDEGKLRELEEYDRQGFALYNELYELRKRVPCPVSGKDVFRQPRYPSTYPDPAAYVDYLRSYRDEVLMRAEQGIGVVAEEKLRVLWTASGPYFFDPFASFEKWGASLVHFQWGDAARVWGALYGVYGDDCEYGRRLSPLEEVARMINCNSWAGAGERWVRDTIAICRDLRVDAIVDFMQWGCTATVGTGKLLEEVAKEDLGISTFHIEGRQLDKESVDQREFRARLDEFLEMSLLTKSG